MKTILIITIGILAAILTLKGYPYLAFALMTAWFTHEFKETIVTQAAKLIEKLIDKK